MCDFFSKCIIYVATSPVGKHYVGQTERTIEKRMSEHNRSNSKCPLLREAIKEYGSHMLSWKVVEQIPKFLVDDREKYWINVFNSLRPHGYNCTIGGSGLFKRRSRKDREGLLGCIQENISKQGSNRGTVTSWSFNVTRRGVTRRTAFATKEEAIDQQRIYTENPDEYKLPEPKRVGNGKGGIYFRKDRNSWAVQPFVDGKMGYIGSCKTRDEAEKLLKYYLEHSVKPERREDVGVTYKQSENIWQAAIYRDKKNRFLGKFKTKEEAINARKMYLADPENFVRPNQRKRNQI